MPGSLHLIPCPIAENSKWTFDEYAIYALRSSSVIVCERIRTTRRMIKFLFEQDAFDRIEFLEMGKRSDPRYISQVLEVLSGGDNVAIMSEAGMPCIADPGYELVMAVHRRNFCIQPHVGPCSFIMALMASGLPAQQFSFCGYLPREQGELIGRLRQLEKLVQKSGTSQIFMETPYRNQKLFDSVLSTVSEGLLLHVSMDINGANELIQTKTIKEWKKQPLSFDEKFPAVFIIGQH